MEEQEKSLNKAKKPIFLYIALAMLLMVMVFGLAKYAIAPVNKLAEWKQNQDTVAVYDEPKLDSIQRLIAYRNALLSLSKKDSIHLIINVPDSTLGLFINGVVIYNVRMTTMKLDPMLRKLSQGMYVQTFSKPLSVTLSEASIIKEPIIEKIAPKNPEELLTSVTTPDTLMHQPVFIKLITENGIHFLITQNEDMTSVDKKANRSFWRGRRMERAKSFLNAMVKFQPYEYKPFVIIEANDKALTAIYRALPEQPKVVVYYE
ncbi:hypothetical protein [uncultured Roseivirga sp.]|jgi:hypothetical protein|uniref:hypothetical protein n=1 Tax=uncultured Roseivirga sp. TaxID=543088 RepID=UPI0030DD64C5|tara:strand:- start:360 stop:1142 length:783 start_codon:yes stop_codon:yes gene_type:complete